MPRKAYDPNDGLPFVITLVAAGTLAASASAVLDRFKVPDAAFTDFKGQALKVWEAQFQVASNGTTGNATVAKVFKNGASGDVIAQCSIAHDDDTLFSQVSCVGSDGRPIAAAILRPGDSLDLLVTAIPDVASANLKVHLMCTALGMKRE